MTPDKLSEIQSRADYGFMADTFDRLRDAETFVQALADRETLLAAVRERDSIIAKVHELMQSWDNGDYDDMNQFSPHHFVRHLRAALDPQETP